MFKRRSTAADSRRQAMTGLCLAPVILSFLLLAAHFLRAGQLAAMVVSLAVPGALIIPRAWSARLVQVALVIGAVEWLRTLLRFVEIRRMVGEAWIRMAVILGAVVLLCLASVMVFSCPALRRRYRL